MTKKESEILADIRNKFGSIYTYFQLEEIIKDPETDPFKIESLKRIQESTISSCIISMKIIKTQLDNLG
jgi:hypothetical protein